MKKLRMDNIGNVECPKCANMTTDSEDGFYCLNCDILFNVCSYCEDCTMLHLKAWGRMHHDEDSENFDENDQNYKHTHKDKENPKWFATADDDEAITDMSMYLWYCPQCKKEQYTQAD